MGTVSLHAVSIDELREVFSGTDATLARLRELALRAWPPPPPPGPPGSLLGKLGPFSRRAPGAPVIRPGIPTGADLDDVAHGRDVPAERLSAAWALVDVWLADAAWGSLSITAADAELDALDFALARAGLPARYGLRQLFNDAVAIPLKRQAGQATGYMRGTHAEAMASAWRAALPALDPAAHADAERLTAWLARFPAWAADADEAGRAAPDLIADYRP